MATLQYPACYRPLPPGYDTTRLLFLLPSKDENAPICCQLVDYSLRGHGRKGHLYECLSYCWGSSEKPCSISIDSIALPITKSLHGALLQLRDPSLQRPLWVDAVCINQEDNDEKEQQIQMMATIYSQARQVIVWLGPEADDSDRAIELIRLAGAGRITELSGGEPKIEYSDDYSDDSNVKFRNQRSKNQAAVTALLQRPWFRRIWVLQEIAAAKHVHIMCGTAEIAGYSLCLGVDSLKDLYEAQPAIKTLVYSVGHLIRGGFFRSNTDMVAAGRSSLNIRPLAELLDMYHAHQATLSHDKIYALLAMCSDDVSKAGIMPNYDMPWEKLLQTVLKYILSEQAVVQVWRETTLSIIKGKGTIIGYIHEVHPATITNEKQEATLAIALASDSEYKKSGRELKTPWSIQPSAHPVHKGDIVCLLQGSSKFSIIRACENHFVVIAIASTPPEVCRSPEDVSTTPRSRISREPRFDEGLIWSDVLRLIESAPVDFVLVWDWIWDNDPQQNMEEHHLPPNNHEIHESLHAVRECYETGVRAAIRMIIRSLGPELRHPLNTTFERLIKCNMDFYITKDLFLEVMSSKWAIRFLEIVFNQEPEEDILAATSKSVLVGATRRCVWESLTPFLKHFGEDIHITEAVWLAVLSNRTHDYHLIHQLLRVHKRIRIEVPITEAMFVAAAEVNQPEELLEILFDQNQRNSKKNRVPIIEAMIIAAASRPYDLVAVLEIMFDQNQRNSKKNRVPITEAMIIAAASRPYDSLVVLDFLFDQSRRDGIDIRALITEAVILAAALSNYHPVVVLDFLFDQNQRAGIDNRPLITEAVLEAAKKYELRDPKSKAALKFLQEILGSKTAEYTTGRGDSPDSDCDSEYY